MGISTEYLKHHYVITSGQLNLTPYTKKSNMRYPQVTVYQKTFKRKYKEDNLKHFKVKMRKVEM